MGIIDNMKKLIFEEDPNISEKTESTHKTVEKKEIQPINIIRILFLWMNHSEHLIFTQELKCNCF